MSKIIANQIQHTQNGAAVFTLPTSDGSADQVIKTNGSGALSFATATDTKGVEMADNWYVNTGFVPANGNEVISANWQRGTATEFGSIGSAMTQSSGIFTFPATGIYRVSIDGGFYQTGNVDHKYMGFYVETTLDNTNYSTRAGNYQALPAQSGTSYVFCMANTIFDVTNTSNCKVRFKTECNGSPSGMVDFSGRYLNATFIKLGDT